MDCRLRLEDVGHRTSGFLCSMPAQSQIREVIAEIDVSWTEGASVVHRYWQTELEASTDLAPTQSDMRSLDPYEYR